MKRFNIPEPSGGFLVKAHDFNFIFDAMKEALGAYMSKDNNCIVSGVNWSQSGANAIAYSAGYVMIGGEVMKFNQTNVNTLIITDPVFVPYETVIAPSPRVEADTTSKNIHFEKVARIEQYVAQTTYVRFADFKTFTDPFHEIDTTGSGAPFAYGSGWAKTATADFQDLAVRKIDNYLEICGSCKTAAFANNSTIVTLPNQHKGINYQPAKIRSLVVPAKISPSGHSIHSMQVDIDPTGAITVHSGSYTSTADLILMFNHRIPLF